MNTEVFGPFRLDRAQRVLFAHGAPVELQPRAFHLLTVLMDARGDVVSRDAIVAAVWHGQIVVANNLTVQMSALRGVLSAHGAPDAIQTIPGRGYRFVGLPPEPPAPVPAQMVAPSAAAQPPPTRISRRAVGAAAMALAASVILALAVSRARTATAVAPSFAADVRVAAEPDEIYMSPEGFCRVDYIFHVDSPGELQLMTEDVRFALTSGEPVSQPSVRGRIYHGSFPISGPGAGTYHNNLYLPGRVMDAARANGKIDVYLHHLFHLEDPLGREVSVPAVVRIVFGTPAQACKHVNDADLPR